MAHYDFPFDEYYAPPARTGGATVPGWQRMLFILGAIAIIVPLLLAIKPEPAALGPVAAAPVAVAPANAASVDEAPVAAAPVAAAPGAAAAVTDGAISPVFSPEVQHWAPQIVQWAGAVGLDPNLAAIIMQIESCGDPAALSHAGAHGLFQVMPFHFAAGEDPYDPDTNARRGLAYYADRLTQTGGDVGRAFAGYNGGQRAAATGWDNWAHETQRYYVWSTGIHADIQNGLSESPTLQEWMAAGGASLCAQAAQRLGLTQ